MRIMPVGDIPISVQNQIMFDGRFVEIVQLGNVQAACVAFCRYAAFFIPGKVLQIQAAAHGSPVCRAHGHTFLAGFKHHTVLQLEVERTADVENTNTAFP